MKKYLYIIILFAILSTGCSSGFNREKAESILQKSEISENEYSELIKYYEIGMDKTLQIALEDRDNLSENDRKEIITIFAIGKRLMIDEDKLTDEQAKEFNRITKKGTEGLTK